MCSAKTVVSVPPSPSSRLHQLVQTEPQGKTFQVSIRLWLIAVAVVRSILPNVQEELVASAAPRVLALRRNVRLQQVRWTCSAAASVRSPPFATSISSAQPTQPSNVTLSQPLRWSQPCPNLWRGLGTRKAI